MKPSLTLAATALTLSLALPLNAHAQFISLGDSHKFIISNTEVARLTSSTRLGIGTQSPTTALEVSGTISATSAIISSIGAGNIATSGNISASGYVRAGFTSTCNSTLTGILRTSGTSVEFCNGTNWSSMGVSAGSNDRILVVRNEQPAGTAENISVTGSYTTRTLNTLNYNGISGSTLSNNRISLPSGTYYVEATAPCYYCFYNQTRLYNITDGTTLLTGTSAYSGADMSVLATIEGVITLSGTKQIELQHYAQRGGSFGLGTALFSNVYSSVVITKLN